MKFAVIKTGGKQYRVKEGDALKVEKLEVEKPGTKITFDEVLLTDDGAKTQIGAPLLKGAKVEAELVKQGRADKIRVVKFKAKVRHHKVYGHRQPYSEIKITNLGF